MTRKKIACIAIGGNALTSRVALKGLATGIALLSRKGQGIVITHGNGPQVGELALVERKSLSVLTAETAAEIGLEIAASLEDAGVSGKKVAVVITRVIADPSDREFRDPSKPIGRFYSGKEAAGLRRNGRAVRKLLKGYRIVVPSPKPLGVLELDEINALLSDGYIVIAGGGGGSAVSRRGSHLSYLDAVLDKDLTSSLLAVQLRADRLVILTDVDGAYLDFGRESERRIGKVDAAAMERYVREGQFERGSMLPKVEACLSFVRKRRKSAAIGSLGAAQEVLELRNCTVVTP
ncbi:MAG: carbamate kinase [Candidatus Marsarchaeota archaeon]|jgi:carbamate kinase|nr:carbamate kinase [Candidatus Marsarchaeota archaeon]